MICVDGTVVGVDYLALRRGSRIRSPALLSGLTSETRVVSRAALDTRRLQFGNPYLRGVLPDGMSVELYSRERFVTVTGNRVSRTSKLHPMRQHFAQIESHAPAMVTS